MDLNSPLAPRCARYRLRVVSFPSLMDEKQLAKLIRKNAARAEKLAKGRAGNNYDKTLPPKPEDDSQDIDREHFFKEMKRREF